MIGIIDYECGNTGSIRSMLRYLGVDSILSRDLNCLENAKGIILPGVGRFDIGMENLRRLGVSELLSELVISRKVPILGICLGAQLMTRWSEEGDCEGLGWIEVNTKRFKFREDQKRLPIPHMGWSPVDKCREDRMCDDFSSDTRFYFVHSYHFETDVSGIQLLESQYGYRFLAAYRQDNIIGVQFHPEKSHRHGLQLMKNFLKLCGVQFQG